ncbi:MAG: DUF1246 domain-containing protein [Candidatus Thermoplasmatota archaeon]|nr:DUF1246 domain-containing protein [Candidatus Thermoplasmatota archaeon]MBS3790155.1 DUF1246 domain-containing protein [Candidatus Thermoplasmatota archaeon]
MVAEEKISKIFEEYNKEDITIATVCSHSSMQRFDDAKKEVFNTVGIAFDERPKFYDLYPQEINFGIEKDKLDKIIT